MDEVISFQGRVMSEDQVEKLSVFLDELLPEEGVDLVASSMRKQMKKLILRTARTSA